MKRLVVVGLLMLLVLGAVGVTEAASLPFKVGLVTGTVSQGEEEYRAAEKMAAKYPGSVIHVTYPDNFMQEQETTMAQIIRLGMDPEVKAIVVVQAVPGTVAAITRIKEFRNDIVFVAGVPHEDPVMVAEVADIAIDADHLRRGQSIVQLAKEMGAEKLLHYSFPRHMSMEMLAARYSIMKEEAAKLGIEIVDVTAPDPMSDAGIPGTQQFVLEDIPRQAATYGTNIAFFGTNCAMMEPAIKASLEAGIIFPEQCCPSPAHGYPGALGISIPEEKSGDIPYLLEQIKEKVAEKGRSGRFATWVAPFNMVVVEAGVELAIQAVNGDIDFADMEQVEEQIAKTTGVNISLERFGEDGNFYLGIADSIIF